MQFILGKNRNQTFFSPMDDQVMADNPVRLLEDFVKYPTDRKLAIIVVVNKLLKQVFGVVKNECLFDRNYYKKNCLIHLDFCTVRVIVCSYSSVTFALK